MKELRGLWSVVGGGSGSIQGFSGAPLRSFILRIYRVYCDWASNKILFFRKLSGISHLGFQQNLIIKDASGDLSKLGGASLLWMAPLRSYHSENLSGMLHLGFRQNLKFKDDSGDLSKPGLISETKRYPTGSSFLKS